MPAILIRTHASACKRRAVLGAGSLHGDLQALFLFSPPLVLRVHLSVQRGAGLLEVSDFLLVGSARRLEPLALAIEMPPAGGLPAADGDADRRVDQVLRPACHSRLT